MKIEYTNYRKEWEKINGPLPSDYEIIHIDGNHHNNEPSNIKFGKRQGDS